MPKRAKASNRWMAVIDEAPLTSIMWRKSGLTDKPYGADPLIERPVTYLFADFDHAEDAEAKYLEAVSDPSFQIVAEIDGVTSNAYSVAEFHHVAETNIDYVIAVHYVKREVYRLLPKQTSKLLADAAYSLGISVTEWKTERAFRTWAEKARGR